jgi:hypothetical protein
MPTPAAARNSETYEDADALAVHRAAAYVKALDEAMAPWVARRESVVADIAPPALAMTQAVLGPSQPARVCHFRVREGALER